MSIEIDHLGIAVRSIEEGKLFYEQLLGIPVANKERIADEQVEVALLPTGTHAGAPRIELLEATDADSTIARFIDKRGPGLHHVALRVDNLACVVERLKEKGARLMNEPRTGAGGHTYVFVHPASAGGVLLELIQK
jgi:methylmalonyl-CoA epimerase